ncbi:MAG: endonuclease domain-containing protein [Bradyrhizobium sp.]|uniref:endonuclease domain-containing protein n=1 Tax=Bradyrhizobium sp. TaxID=376 RepID=UPI00271DB9E8|nr:endonuclease domain-containing protein [Bradyrhizobium sp.]MDO8399285.1 endonuclease domain-containing protein [Bradyrhizobium sp.]
MAAEGGRVRGMRQRVPKQKRARTLRANATDAEIALWRLLRSRRLASLKFRRQVPIGPWIVDFVSFEKRLIVEADGSQHAESDNDKRRDHDLSERGFRILRFWNNDILLRSQSVLEMIFESAAPSPSPVCAPDGAHPPSPTRGEGKEEKSE